MPGPLRGLAFSGRSGFRLYEWFRPSVPAGESGWEAKGELDLAKVRAAAAVGVRLPAAYSAFGTRPSILG